MACAHAQVNVKGFNNVRVVVKTFSFAELKETIRSGAQVHAARAAHGRPQKTGARAGLTLRPGRAWHGLPLVTPGQEFRCVRGLASRRAIVLLPASS